MTLDNMEQEPGKMAQINMGERLIMNHEVPTEKCVAELDPAEVLTKGHAGTSQHAPFMAEAPTVDPQTALPDAKAANVLDNRSHRDLDITTIVSSAPSNADSISAAKSDHDSAATENFAAHKVDPRFFSFIKSGRGRYKAFPGQKLRNNLLPSVGFLEFANATDFAANVWNSIPVPIYAAVLMGLGGSIGIILSFFAVKDGLLSWRNIRILRTERAELLGDEIDKEKGATMDASERNVRLEVNRREVGQELIDRFSMDVFMGFSALIVAIGTLMAIGGANPRVYHASNLLSGYIGNSPSALWGLANSLWSAYLFRRATRHFDVGTRDLRSEAVKARLKVRTRTVKFHAFLMGVSTLVSAPAGMVTVTRWWGYPMLIPCIILAKWGNVVYRRRIGYTRDMVRRGDGWLDNESVVAELEWTIEAQAVVRVMKKKPVLRDVMAKLTTKTTMSTEFLVRCGLLEELGKKLLNAKVISAESNTVEIDQPMVVECERTSPSFAVIAQATFEAKGLKGLVYKERYLLEILGAGLFSAANGASPIGVRIDSETIEEKKVEEKTNTAAD